MGTPPQCLESPSLLYFLQLCWYILCEAAALVAPCMTWHRPLSAHLSTL